MTTKIAKRTPRAIADVTEATVFASVDIEAPIERVFAALTVGEELVRWWGSDDTYRTTEWVADLRVGGHWRAAGRGADGAPFSVEGDFLAVEPPSKIVQTWKPEWDGGHVTISPIASRPSKGAPG